MQTFGSIALKRLTILTYVEYGLSERLHSVDTVLL
jgi:hypothetical protein